MNRITELSFPPNVKTVIAERLTVLLTEWNEIQHFILWEYSNKHLKMEDEDAIHCCQHALGKHCIHIHKRASCNKCSVCFDFFERKIGIFLLSIKDHISEKDEEQEFKSMIKAVPKFAHAVVHYMAHRLCAVVQFAVIREVEESLKTDSTKIFIVIDHKQKIQQMKYHEGQVEYYGKKGMS